MEGLRNQTAIVTGGSSGIGRATAKRLAEEGANVVVADVDEDQGREVATSIDAASGNATFVTVDVSSTEDTEQLVEKTIDAFGTLDIAINNAGILEWSIFTSGL